MLTFDQPNDVPSAEKENHRHCHNGDQKGPADVGHTALTTPKANNGSTSSSDCDSPRPLSSTSEDSLEASSPLKEATAGENTDIPSGCCEGGQRFTRQELVYLYECMKPADEAFNKLKAIIDGHGISTTSSAAATIDEHVAITGDVQAYVKHAAVEKAL